MEPAQQSLSSRGRHHIGAILQPDPQRPPRRSNPGQRVVRGIHRRHAHDPVLGFQVVERVVVEEVLQHVQAVEELTPAHRALNVAESDVLVSHHLDAGLLHAPQHLAHRLSRLERHALRNGVEEHADHVLDAVQLGRASGHGRAEHRFRAARRVAEHEPQSGAEHGVQGDSGSAGLSREPGRLLLGELHREAGREDRLGACGGGVQDRRFSAGELVHPGLLGRGRILAGGPGEVVGEACLPGGHGPARIRPEQIAKDQLTGPPIPQEQVVREQQPVPSSGQPQHGQPGQRRLGEVERAGPVGGQHRVQVGRILDDLDMHRHRPAQHRALIGERQPRRRMRLQHRRERPFQRRHIETIGHIKRVLRDVDVGVPGEFGLEVQPLLQRRPRQHTLVRRSQFGHPALGDRAHGIKTKTLIGVRQEHAKLVPDRRNVDFQQVRRAQVVVGPDVDVLAGRRPVARVLGEPAEVVEQDLRCAQARQSGGAARVHVAQKAVTETVARRLLRGCGQADRGDAGEPADRARQVSVAFPAVPFEIHHQAGVGAPPAVDRLVQRGQQCAGHVTGQRGRLDRDAQLVVAGLPHRQPERHRPRVQLSTGSQSRLPLRELGEPRGAAGLLGEAARERPQRRRHRVEVLACVRAAQVLGEDVPGDAVHDQVVGDEQQAVVTREVHRFEHPTGVRVEPGHRVPGRTLDQLGAGALDGGQGDLPGLGDLLGPQHGRRAAQAQAQRVVVGDQLVQRGLQLAGGGVGGGTQDVGLVQAVDAAAEFGQPVHDRQQRYLADAVGLHDLLHGGCGAGEGRRGAFEEDIARGEPDAAALGAVDELDRHDAVAAEGEEVAVPGHRVQPEHLGEQSPQGSDLGAFAGRLRCSAGDLPGRCGQGVLVELAVDGQRQGVQRHERRRHHVVRQHPGEVGANGIHVGAAAGPGHQVRHQLAVAHDHRRVGHPGQGEQRRLDFAGLDAVAANLHLVIRAAEVDQFAVFPAGQVTRAVEPGAVRPGDEAGCGETGPVQVAAGELGAGHVHLTGDTFGDGLQVGVEHVDAQAGQGGADHAGPGDIRRVEGAERDVHGGLRDAVHVDQHGVGVAGVPGAQTGQVQRLTAEDDVAQRQVIGGGRVGFDQRVERGRRLVEHGDALVAQQRPEPLRITGNIVRHGDQPAAVEQRTPQFPDREIEGVRVEHRPHVIGPEGEQLVRGGEQGPHIAMGDHDALGLAGRPRGVDDIRRVVAVQRNRGPGAGTAGRLHADAAFADHADRVGVGEDVVLPGRGGCAVDRYVAAAGLDDGQQRDDQVLAAREADGHAGFGPDAAGDEFVRELVGAVFEFGVGEVVHGDGVGSFEREIQDIDRHRLGQVRDAAAHRRHIGHRSGRPGSKRNRRGGHAELQSRDRAVEVFDQLVQDVRDLLHQAAGGRLPHCRVVLDLQGQAVAGEGDERDRVVG